MRTAATVTDRVLQPPETVLTARVTRAQVEKLGAGMKPADALSSPGPALAADVTLSGGQQASMIFHERKDLLEIAAAAGMGIEAGLAGLLANLGVTADAITWTHPDINRLTIDALLFWKLGWFDGVGPKRLLIAGDTSDDPDHCPHCGQSLHANVDQMDEVFSRFGVQKAEVEQYLTTAREYLKDSTGKAATYAKENPGRVAAGVAAIAIGARLIYAALHEE